MLPIPDQPYLGHLTYDAKDPDTSFPPIEPLLPPEGAPNVLIVLLDDVGFGAASAFGGPASTPTAERLQRDGLSYNRFHTTALCAPTRAALLSGRNHHSVGMGPITETATVGPGLERAAAERQGGAGDDAEAQRLLDGAVRQVPRGAAVAVLAGRTVRRVAVGRRRFRDFYGFIGGENNQYYPALYEGTSPVEPEKTPEEGYHLTEDLADRAIDWVRTQKALAPDKPFFVYFAPGATHAPHHVPLEWADKYAGQFADGWDAQREAIFARQKELGVVPADAELTPRPEAIPAWDDMDDDLKPVLERQMEVYAGFLEHTDFHVGRLIDAIESIGALDNTLVYYIIGDNGASAEGTVNGAFNEMANFNGLAAIETPEFMASVKDKLGTVDAYNHYSVGWAWAMCAPYQWTKQVASHWGGTRNGTIVHWPAGITSQGRDALPVQPRDRRRTNRARGRRHPRTPLRQRRAAVADRGHQHGLQLRGRRRPRAPRPAVLRDGRQPGHLLQGLERRHPAQHPVAAQRGPARPRRRRLGALRRQHRLDPGARPRRERSPNASRRCNGCG